jgi:hypothetical protein
MTMNNMANAYAVFSPDLGASPSNHQITTFSRAVPMEWNSPVLMTPDSTVYGQVLRRLFVASRDYADTEFRFTTIGGLTHLFGTDHTPTVFAHLVCIIYDHAVLHRLYHETCLSGLRKGVSRQEPDCDPDIVSDLGRLLDKVTCRLSDTIRVLPNSAPFLASIVALDSWILGQAPSAPWLHVSSSAASISN